MYYYDIHVFFSRNDGYSFGLVSPIELDEDAAIAEAVNQDLFTEDGDQYHVDTVDEVSAEEYQNIFGDL